MNQMAVALKSIPTCNICHEALSPAHTKLGISAHFDCIWLDAETSPSKPSVQPVETPIRMRQVTK